MAVLKLVYKRNIPTNFCNLKHQKCEGENQDDHFLPDVFCLFSWILLWYVLKLSVMRSWIQMKADLTKAPFYFIYINS